MKGVFLWIGLLSCFFFQHCYSFRGISIDPETKTYYVGQFKNNAFSSPAALEVTIQEALNKKIRTETRLIFNDTQPDISFEGSLVDYLVTSEAPKAGESTAINRLTIRLAVDYIVFNKDGSVNEDKGWKSNFSYFYDFDSNIDLSSIEDEAIDAIITQLMEDIFNKAFADW
ncbi:MAG: hypothetical protein KDC85_16995 [Saprospiraceae bacterium]|nr:hypothetical protein [Saprospiraceae bacterium]MCB9325570.1 hypothetical protein [Lewinellaceae bacterium]